MTTTTTGFKSPAVAGLHELRERRGTPRIRTPVPVRLRVSGARHKGDVASVVDNISAGGFYVRLMQKLEPGARVFALIKFVVGSSDAKNLASLAVRGRVVRVDELPGCVYGVAVKICRYRFM